MRDTAWFPYRMPVYNIWKEAASPRIRHDVESAGNVANKAAVFTTVSM